MVKKYIEILAESIADRTGHCLCNAKYCRGRREYRAREVINDLRVFGFQIKPIAKTGTKVRQSAKRRTK